MFYLFKRPSTAIELARLTKTPWRLQRWVKWNISYLSDIKQYGKREHYETSAEVLRTRKADCDGYMVLYYDTLGAMGIEDRHMVGVMPKKGQGHAVCVYYDGGEWYTASSDGIKGTYAIFLKQVPKYVNSNWDNCILFEQEKDGTLKARKRKFRGFVTNPEEEIWT